MNPEWLYLGRNEHFLSHAKQHGCEQQQWQLTFSILWRKIVFKLFMRLLRPEGCVHLARQQHWTRAVCELEPASAAGTKFYGTTQCCHAKPHFLFSSWGFLGNFPSLGRRPRHTRARMKRRVVFLHLRCDACLGFVGFPGVGVVLSPLCSRRGGQPPCRSPQCLSIANLSTAGRFHGDHSWASLHGYGGTLAVGWGAAADGWGYPAILGQVGWAAVGQLGAARHGPAGWGQQQVGDSRSWATAGG